MSECIIEVDVHNREILKPYFRGEIVRCRDCLSWFKGYCNKHAYEVANEYGDMFTEGCFPMDADGFCSLGVRRDA